MQLQPTEIEGVAVVTPRRHYDARGWFSETWSRGVLAATGLDFDFVQDNHSFSRDAGTVRGLHCQRPPRAQAKLVRVAEGRILDVAVDVRRGSPSFGRWVSVELSADNGRQLLIPAGFLHGFVTREPGTQVLYKCSDSYAPDCESSVAWDDPDLAIDWGLAADQAVLSDKDRASPRFADWTNPFTWESGR